MKYAERIFFSEVCVGNSSTAWSVDPSNFVGPGVGSCFFISFFDFGNSIEGIYIFMGCKSVTNYIFMIIFIFFVILIGTTS